MLPEPITKLIIDKDQAEDAEQIISLLRNSGIALRPQRVSTEEELAATAAEMGGQAQALKQVMGFFVRAQGGASG